MTLSQISQWLLIIIPVSAVPRALLCLIKIGTGSDDSETYKRRLINLFKFIVIAETAISVLWLLQKYFGKGMGV